MARIRKEPNRYWSKEDKLKIINEVLINCKSTEEVAKEYDISGGMLRNWIIKYNQYGDSSLENKKKPGNPLMKYSSKKNRILYFNIEKFASKFCDLIVTINKEDYNNALSFKNENKL